MKLKIYGLNYLSIYTFMQTTVICCDDAQDVFGRNRVGSIVDQIESIYMQ